jgi:hypothetical protein
VVSTGVPRAHDRRPADQEHEGVEGHDHQGARPREAGISTETLYAVEHGKRDPSIKTLEKIAKALDVEARDFFS